MKKIIMIFILLVTIQESVCMQKITLQKFNEGEKDAVKILSLLNKNSKPKSVASVDEESWQPEQQAKSDDLKSKLEDVVIDSDDEGWVDN